MNFLPARDSAEDFVKKSLQVLEAECPPAYNEMCRLLNKQTIMLRIGEELIPLCFEDEGISYPPSTEIEPVELRISTDWKTILELADVRLTLIDAVYKGRIGLYGSAKDLALVYDGILTFLRGGVRSPSFPHLLDHFRNVYERNRQLP